MKAERVVWVCNECECVSIANSMRDDELDYFACSECHCTEFRKESRDMHPSVCQHGNRYFRCVVQECVDEMIAAEDAAYCPHGFLAGCPVCTGELII